MYNVIYNMSDIYIHIYYHILYSDSAPSWFFCVAEYYPRWIHATTGKKWLADCQTRCAWRRKNQESRRWGDVTGAKDGLLQVVHFKKIWGPPLGRHSWNTKTSIMKLGTGAKRREWMGCGGCWGCWGLLGVAGMSITSDYGSFPHSSFPAKHQ